MMPSQSPLSGGILKSGVGRSAKAVGRGAGLAAETKAWHRTGTDDAECGWRDAVSIRTGAAIQCAPRPIAIRTSLRLSWRLMNTTGISDSRMEAARSEIVRRGD